MDDRLNRRDVLKTLMTLGATSLLGSCEEDLLNYEPVYRLSASTLFKEQFLARKSARKRIRRIIYNNDGSDVEAYGGVISPEQFLNARTSWMEHSHVDSIFYCTGVFNMYSHRSTLTESPLNNQAAMSTINLFAEFDTDSLEIMINCCRQQKKEIFWSMRMNDLRDATRPEMLSEYKKNNPAYLVGASGVPMPFMSEKWSALDSGVKEVRERAVAIVNDVIIRYDLDGIELDFFRYPALFKAQFYGEDVTQIHCDMITEMLVEIRTDYTYSIY